MFGEMRKAVGIPKEVDILDHLHSLPEPQQGEAFAKIQEIERTAMAKQIPQAGLVSLMEFLDENGIHKGICTRNFEYVHGRIVPCLSKTYSGLQHTRQPSPQHAHTRAHQRLRSSRYPRLPAAEAFPSWYSAHSTCMGHQ